MNLTPESLYQLLPAIHRLRDARLGEPLKALLAVVSEQGEVVRADIEQLYENLFIETCEEWMVPYHAELLGVRGLHDLTGVPGFSQRAYIANTLAYRRRKGTVPMLEQLAEDVTGWGARAVEFFELLEWTTNVNHVRLHSVRTPCR